MTARSLRARSGLAGVCLAALLPALLLGLAGCNLFAPEPPPVLGEVPAFRLVSDDGAPFDSSALAGKNWLASFLFTSCPGPCPKLVERLKTLRTKIPPEKLALVSFSVDPTTDTPEALAAYKRARGISDKDAWTFVTGAEDEVLTLVRRGFLVGVERSADPAGEEGAVIHGVRVALIDGSRRIRGFYNTESAEDLERLEKELDAIR